MTFLHKRVEEGHGTFGSHLRDLRDLQNITIQQASRETKIRDTMLLALEEDRLEDMDDPVFAERHLLAYVRFLGGHEPYFTARYRERLKSLNAKRLPNELLPRKRGVRSWDLLAGPQFVAAAGILILGAAFGSYVLWQAHLVRIPPTLDVISPQDGEHVKSPTVMVSGQTMAEAIVTVNGKEAPVDDKGAFAMSLDVRRGTTVLTIVARRRRGSETQINRSVVYDVALFDSTIPDRGLATSSATGTH